ncbi:uncharacterized protein LOC126668373 [Mercurialis annua]|uniref:uncharacterized protein LOC126668373 n=1 Tax=Mercurialis annua TaxID=3986 RepID=UPI002160BC61|nr:uncharacterized protein LOC126668373 [Mercurialis annua]
MANHLKFLLCCEESYYKQKSRVQWLNLGDSNTKFFHNSLKQRRIVNCIPILQLEDGSTINSSNEIHIEMTRFYKNLFRKGDFNRNHIKREEFRKGFILAEEDGVTFMRKVTEQEVKTAVFSIGPDKAAAPDGYNGHFFKATWRIIKDDLVKSVQEAFISGKILNQIKTTAVTVIPKSSNANSLNDFRPISCYCVSQSYAFVPKRSIAHNIMLAHELVKNYHCNKDYPRCLLKIDLKKAYDSISWDYIEEILIALNFPDNFIILVMNCIRSPSFYIAWCGNKGDSFVSSKGLRQGDPISPHLFVICMEYLSRTLSNTSNVFKFHHGCGPLKVNHLMFADDLLLFFYGDKNSIGFLMECLTEFRNTSGLQVNNSKSQVFFCNVEDSTKRSITCMTGFKEGVLPLRYLGIPLISTKLSRDDCKGIIEKITSKIHSWNSKFLSYAVRMQLIQSVLLNMQVFWATILILPKNVISEIQRICSKFLWSGSSEGRNKAMVAWKEIEKLKKEGGLSIKNMKIWNRVANCKHVWHILNNPNALWVKWINNNKLKRRSLWSVKSHNYTSWIRKGILSIREDVKKLIDFRIGNGVKTDFWNDPWLTGCSMSEKFPKDKMRETGVPKNVAVASLWRNNSWHLPETNDPETEAAWNYIRSNSHINVEEEDTINWKVMKGEKFSISKTWEILRDHHPETKDKLRSWGIVNDDMCVLCGEKTETINHCMFECEIADQIWKTLLPAINCNVEVRSWKRLLSWFCMKARGNSKLAKFRRLVLTTFIYMIWISKNRKAFLGEDCSSTQIINKIRNVLIAKFSEIGSRGPND